MKIIFNSNRDYNSNENAPSPAKKNTPKWFLDASKYWTDENNKPMTFPPDYKKGPGFKSCPALHDVFSSGYMFTTPCDIAVSKIGDVVYIQPEKDFKGFCDGRPHMGEFHYPDGYYKQSYHWYPNWGFTLPEGYSALVIHPINHFELPFLTTSGIIDSDRYGPPGLIPFFIKNTFQGIIKKGTPYAQIFPYKREEWTSEVNLFTEEEMVARHEAHTKIYRHDEFGNEKFGVYKQKTWVPKKYE
jgi:hypothetical protein